MLMERADTLLALESLLNTETDRTACMANAAAFLYHEMENVNWLGFYLLKQGQLVLGPFQGKPACARIQPGRGVCGTAIAQGRVLRVKDVRAFRGHIACDADSRSEMVLPLTDAAGEPFGVLDIDSPLLDRFSEEDERFAAAAIRIISVALMNGTDA